MNLNQWAIKWGIPFEAVEDLRLQMGMITTDPNIKEGESEDAVQTRVRLEATRKGLRLWRNNSGALYDMNGRLVRYGLCNESKEMNKKIKSSDLLGIRPRTIKAADVGSVIGQFVAREVKPEGWQYTGSGREVAQLAFLNLVLSLGGDAAFCNSEGSL